MPHESRHVSGVHRGSVATASVARRQKDKQEAYKEFLSTEPSLEDYSAQLKSFQGTDDDINSIATCHNIGALSLNTTQLKGQLKADVEVWQKTYCNNLRDSASISFDFST